MASDDSTLSSINYSYLSENSATNTATMRVLATSPISPVATTTSAVPALTQKTVAAAIGAAATNAPSVFLAQLNIQNLDLKGIGDTEATQSSVLRPFVVTLPPKEAVTQPESDLLLPKITPLSGRSERTTSSDAGESGIANNRRYLMEKLVGDVLIGSGVTFAVAPFLTIADKAIVQKSAGTHTLIGSAMETTATIFRAPSTYFRSPMFLLMWGVYASTYSTANSLKTMVDHAQKFPSATGKVNRSGSETTASKYGKASIFAGTTTVNVVLSVLKDRAYSRLFTSSSSAIPKAVPFMSYGMWASRDMMVIGSSFLLPDVVSSRVGEAFPSLAPSTVHSATQFLCPVATQVLAGPAHLAGLDWYTRPRATLWERVMHQYANFGSVVWARIARIAPGYGIGGVGNSKLREAWRDAARRRWEDRKLHGESAQTLFGQTSSTLTLLWRNVGGATQ